MSRLGEGLDGGPLVVFDNTGHAVVISAFNQFMAASFSHNQHDHTVSWGIMGDVDTVPEGFQLQTIIYYTDKGINKVHINL